MRILKVKIIHNLCLLCNVGVFDACWYVFLLSKKFEAIRIDVFVPFKKIHWEKNLSDKCISSVQSLSCVWFFVTPWTAGRQASLSITNSWSLLRLMSIESVMPSNHLILCRPLLPPSIFPSIRVFQMSQFFSSGGQNIGVSPSTSILPMNTQDWFLFGWTGWISLQSKGLSRVFSSTTVQKHQFFGTQLSL